MPEEIEHLYQRGSELFEQGNYAEAEGILKEVIRHNPDYADVLNKLGFIANMNGRLAEAASYFERAIELNPHYTEAALNLTITYNEMGETDKAGRVFRESARDTVLEPGSIDPFAAGKLANEHFRVGNIYMGFGLLEQAVEEYRKALGLRPGFPDIHTKLGIALRDLKQYDEAVSEFTKAKEANPYYGPAMVQLGLTYYMQGLTGLAFEEWEEALRKVPGLKEAESLLKVFKRGE